MGNNVAKKINGQRIIPGFNMNNMRNIPNNNLESLNNSNSNTYEEGVEDN